MVRLEHNIAPSQERPAENQGVAAKPLLYRRLKSWACADAAKPQAKISASERRVFQRSQSGAIGVHPRLKALICSQARQERSEPPINADGCMRFTSFRLITERQVKSVIDLNRMVRRLNLRDIALLHPQ